MNNALLFVMNFGVAKQRCIARSIGIILLVVPFNAWPHGFAGKRFFPTTLAIDDPFVADEFSLTTGHIKEPGAGEDPATLSTELSAEYTKRITPRFGLTLGGDFRHLEPNGKETVNGFGNLDVGAKYQFFTSDAHEALASIGLEANVGDTGDQKAEANAFSTLSPVLFFGKGLGDLPETVKYLRPLAITGIFGADFPLDSQTVTQHVNEDGEIEEEVEQHPTKLRWGTTIQYNFQYLQSFVSDSGLAAPFNRMIPLVEFAMETCLNRGCEGQTTGTVNPGVIWFGKYLQLGISAQIPVNDRSGDNVGVLAQVHFFIDDIFPTSVGKPLFGETTPRPSWWQPVVR
jgi:hypothetical protein